jgi:16S rRNA G1207 methylase RsmC
VNISFFNFKSSSGFIDFNRRIVELGAGSGLLGLALLRYSDTILSYKFTDYSPMILNLLRQNALLNFSDDELDVGFKLDTKV